MSEQPDRDRVSADEERLGELLRAVEAPAPASLHAQVGRLIEGHQPRRRFVSPRPALAFTAAAGVIAATVVAIVLATSAASAPTALGASRLALAAPTGPAGHRLVASGTAIAFPDWSARGWPSTGARHDSFGGRTVTTEFYRAYHSTEEIGYAIVSGAPLRWGSSARMVTRRHGEYVLLSSGGARIVAWVQDGHTCVLASRTVSSETMLELAVAEDGTATVAAASPWGGQQPLPSPM
jgi:hypothetical protein